jgi:hypothetical protein
VIKVLAIASVVVEYPPVPAGTVQSMVVSGFRSEYHQRRLPASVPVVTVKQVRLEPSTPRPFATIPTRPHSSPALALFDGTFAAFAVGTLLTTRAKAVMNTPAPVISFFKLIFFSYR